MLKKLLLVSFMLISTYTFSQKNQILISPPSMTATSAIIIATKERGNYTLLIKRKNSNEVLYTKEVFIDNKIIFKHNFSSFQKGDYTFILKKDKEEIFSAIKTKQ